jgi:hypothetical protein
MYGWEGVTDAYETWFRGLLRTGGGAGGR